MCEGVWFVAAGCAKKCKYRKKLCSKIQRMLRKLCSRMRQMRDYPAWYLCQNHSKTAKMCQDHRELSELRIKSDPKIEKVTENVPQICPKISKSAEKSASNLTLNFGKWQKMRLKSDPKISTLPRAKSPNLSSYTLNENSVVSRNVTGVFYAKMGSK